MTKGTLKMATNSEKPATDATEADVVKPTKKKVEEPVLADNTTNPTHGGVYIIGEDGVTRKA